MPDGGDAFEPSSKTDAKASMYTVHQVEDVEDYVCVRNNIPCKIKWIMTVKNPKHKDGPRKRLFVATDVFSGKLFKATFSMSDTCVVPRVTYTDYQLVDISEDDSDWQTLADEAQKRSCFWRFVLLQMSILRADILLDEIGNEMAEIEALLEGKEGFEETQPNQVWAFVCIALAYDGIFS